MLKKIISLLVASLIVLTSITYASNNDKKDSTPPTIKSIVPANNSAKVKITDKTISITFNEPVKEGVNYKKINVVKGSTSITIKKVISGNKLILTNIKNWSEGSSYTITIPSGAVCDMAGNCLEKKSIYSFKTITTTKQKDYITSFKAIYKKDINTAYKLLGKPLKETKSKYFIDLYYDGFKIETFLNDNKNFQVIGIQVTDKKIKVNGINIGMTGTDIKKKLGKFDTYNIFDDKKAYYKIHNEFWMELEFNNSAYSKLVGISFTDIPMDRDSG